MTDPTLTPRQQEIVVDAARLAADVAGTAAVDPALLKQHKEAAEALRLAETKQQDSLREAAAHKKEKEKAAVESRR